MKKSWIFSSMLALVFLFCLLPARNAQAANPQQVDLTGGSYYTNYDITGDGVNDTIQITKDENPDSVYYVGSTIAHTYEGMSIIINGSEAIHLTHEYDFYDGYVKLYTLQDGTVIVYIYLQGDDLDGPCRLYVYDNGRLNQLLNFQTFFKYGSHNTGEVLKVSGNRLKVKFYSVSQAFAGIDMKYTYQYKNGRLVPAAKYGKVKIHKNYGYGRGKKVTARKSFWLYKNAVSSRKKIKVKKGQTFKVMKCYVNGSKVRFQIKLTNEKKGWLKSPKKFLRRPLIKETMYAG